MSRDTQEEDVVNICLRTCDPDNGDNDCTASAIGNTLCREIRFGQDACVAAEVMEGEVAELSMLRGGPMTGCNR